MIRINLLPHREAAKKAKRDQFYALAGLVAVLGGVMVFVGSTIIDGQIAGQQEKNDILKKEISILDKQISEINRLKEQTQSLLSRKQVIESLQRDRGEPVYLLSELVKQIPEGVYLKSLKQEGTLVSLVGYAQSNARVSNLMRSLESSPWLEQPQLVETKAVLVDKRRLNEFSMTVKITRTESGSVK